MRMGDISVPLKRPEVFRCRADLTGPKHSFASVAVVTEPKPIFNVRHMLRHQRAIAAKAVAGKDQPVAANRLNAAIRAQGSDAMNQAIREIKRFCTTPTNNVDTRPFGCASQSINQLTARAGRQAMHSAA